MYSKSLLHFSLQCDVMPPFTPITCDSGDSEITEIAECSLDLWGFGVPFD